MNDNMKDWTIDELVVAAITLEHDLRGSWNRNYSDRIYELIFICELICDHENAIKPKSRAKKEFINNLRGTPDLMAAALDDIGISNSELNNDWGVDGRVFRDSAAFYNMTFPAKGKTERVIEFLKNIVDCDDYHWFQYD